MYQKFPLKTRDGKVLAGLSWKVESPRFVMCIIHGIGEHAGRYDRMAEWLKDANIGVIAMDLRGHGESFGKRGHCAPRQFIFDDIDQLLGVAQDQYPKCPLILYGHSMGGNIVLDYKSRGNKNDVPAAYIISAPWIELVRSVPKPLYVAVKAISKLLPAAAINSNVSSDDLGHPQSVGEYKKDPLVHNKISLLCAKEAFETGEKLVTGALESNGKAAGTPMLLMHGTKDRVCNVKGSQKVAALEQCDYIEWPGLYHEIHNGSADNTGDEVIEKMIQWVLELAV